MQFCKTCGSIMFPKDIDGKRMLTCNNGHTQGFDIKKVNENINEKIKHKELDIVDKETETLPLTDEKCEKCGHTRAYFWEVQTRASDEPATKFLKCEKCKHTWRDYS